MIVEFTLHDGDETKPWVTNRFQDDNTGTIYYGNGKKRNNITNKPEGLWVLEKMIFSGSMLLGTIPKIKIFFIN